MSSLPHMRNLAPYASSKAMCYYDLVQVLEKAAVKLVNGTKAISLLHCSGPCRIYSECSSWIRPSFINM
ncbi:hypothetical protein Y1Q_0000992 [Alligator mississippiensis]|uniref:Uncharacterized protein n=1 Tax=Alligator mississippiensis TaxID=8496 RepID=A0A151NE52_ALLMI|nr:hypothetical protein Y1Q_0000992 [Alligator mississippiensis]